MISRGLGALVIRAMVIIIVMGATLKFGSLFDTRESAWAGMRRSRSP
jgi:hypothetical protein